MKSRFVYYDPLHFYDHLNFHIYMHYRCRPMHSKGFFSTQWFFKLGDLCSTRQKWPINRFWKVHIWRVSAWHQRLGSVLLPYINNKHIHWWDCPLSGVRTGCGVFIISRFGMVRSVDWNAYSAIVTSIRASWQGTIIEGYSQLQFITLSSIY